MKYEILKLIAEGYYNRSEEDRYIICNNPDFREDDGSNPYIVFDTILDDPIKELIEAIRPIVEQNPEIMFRGHAPDYVKLDSIPVSYFTRLRLAFEAVTK